jgi:hypothetical protein
MTALPLWLPEVVRLLRDGECAWPEGEAADVWALGRARPFRLT